MRFVISFSEWHVCLMQNKTSEKAGERTSRARENGAAVKWSQQKFEEGCSRKNASN
jgi:hypothetical protein